MTATDSTFSNDLKASDTRCHFFRLSAELRNRIYREVLVKKYSISIDTSGDEDYGRDTFAQPGLIRTCRQIRSEATSIYYLENHFSFELAGVNASKLFAFCEQTGGYWKKGIQSVYIHDEDGMSWSDMMTWLETYHAGKAPSCKSDHWDIGSQARIPYDLFLLIDEMNKDRQMEWAKVASILKLTKDIADATGPWTWG